MGSNAELGKPHAICIPFPAQGHVNPMMKFAKLLHLKGFHISFVNTHFNHKRLLRSQGPSSLDGLPDFRFYSIPDGLPPSDADATQSIPDLFHSIPKHCVEPFCELITRLNGASDVPRVSCIVSDGAMTFTLKAAEKFGLPEVFFWTTSACGLLGYLRCRDLMQKGYTPLKDMSYVTNGYLETILDWIPGMNNIRLRDFPSFIRTTDINDILLNYLVTEAEALTRGSVVVLNTFDALEKDTVNLLTASMPRIFTVGPLNLMQQHVQDERVKQLGSSLWKEDVTCIHWLDTKDPGSVVFVNYGSITVLTKEQLIEFAWGLANSKKDFLWITRPDIVCGNEAVMPPEFLVETKGRGLIISWCPQEQLCRVGDWDGNRYKCEKREGGGSSEGDDRRGKRKVDESQGFGVEKKSRRRSHH
ncbi:UDP-glycosyltransferase 85A8 isoform X2 [Helianthus annuus]|uniref:UDP-glycosyltransferase 85A8 isoform X2 n=1 Tax=Helianthus annuus TaxID=4232 RepID=UPI001652D799|nr:UDP-glycosyltransferase 85A8 isoform X2 [Helianthus annuus]